MSLNVASGTTTEAVHTFESVSCEIVAVPAATAGFVVSLTVKVVFVVALLPAWSVTVTVMVWGPFPTIVLASGF